MVTPPIVKNKRFYLFNETSYVLNANPIDETPSNTTLLYSEYYSASWQFSDVSPKLDGTTDPLDIFYGYMRKSSNLNQVNLNMLKTNDANTFVDLSTINITASNNSIGTAIFQYGTYTYYLTNTSSFINSYESNTSGTITLNPNSSFYGKINLTYRTRDLSNNLSDIETLVIYILPYSYLRITQLNSIDTETINDPTFSNKLFDPAYTFTLSEVNPKNIIVRISNSHNELDSSATFNSSTTGSLKITNYLNSLTRGTINNIEILSTNINTENTLDTFFTTNYSSIIRIPWASYQTFILTLDNVSLSAVYNTFMRLTTNTTNINGNSRYIYGNFTFVVTEPVFIGDINYKSGESDPVFTQIDSSGSITTHSYNGVPLHNMITITNKPIESISAHISVDLTDTQYFKYSTLVIITNATEEDIYVNIQNSGTGIENNTIYVSSDNIEIIRSNKKMVFMRVLFDPIIWEPSDEFSLD
jgi:hypothetical protein